MEPDYENMNDRIMRLPIAEELKQDMVDGITYCKKFSVSSLRDDLKNPKTPRLSIFPTLQNLYYDFSFFFFHKSGNPSGKKLYETGPPTVFVLLRYT